ncbi:MAG TPA: hypothetical protein VGD78_04495 [Chthoniobacterales bacterium]
MHDPDDGAWAFRQGYTATDLMAEAKSKDRYAENKEILRVDDYRCLLFVAAGLEPIHPGEAPTTRYQRLLPRYVLGGLAGCATAKFSGTTRQST